MSRSSLNVKLIVCVQYRARPHKYPNAGLGKYLERAEKLYMPEEDILMDMHQMICVGAYGGVTSSVSQILKISDLILNPFYFGF